MVREVRQRVRVQPGGIVHIQSLDLPDGAEAEVVRYDGPAVPTFDRPPERPIGGFTEVVQWFHNGEWRAKVDGTGLEV